MEEMEIRKDRARELYAGLDGTIKRNFDGDSLKWAMSRSKRGMRDDIETIDEVENEDPGLVAYRKALNDAGIVDAEGKITDAAKGEAIAVLHAEALKKSKERLREKITIQVHKVKEVHCRGLGSLFYDAIYPIMIPATDEERESWKVKEDQEKAEKEKAEREKK